MDEQIFLNLKNCLSPINEVRKNAENFLSNLKIFKLHELLQNLFLVFSDTSNNIDINIQNISCLLYKNILTENGIWYNLPSTLKSKIFEDLNKLIENSNDENKIKNSCIILAIILFKECEMNEIKNFKSIIKKVQKGQNDKNDKIIISYLFVIKTFFDEFEEQKLLAIDVINSLQSIIMPIIKNYNNQIEGQNILEEKKVELSLDIYALIIPFMRFSFTNNADYVLKPLIDLIQKINKEKSIYMKILLVLNDAINYYHRYIVDYIKSICSILFDFLDKIAENNSENNNNNKNEIIIEDNNNYNQNQNLLNIVLYYLDIICLICDKELADKTSLTPMFDNKSKDIYIPTLLSILDKFPEFNIENESWNISKAVCYIISFIINISTDDEILQELFSYFFNNFNSISLSKKINSLLILSCLLDSNNLNIITNTLQMDIINLINKIDDNNKIYSYVVSWILGKISENIPILFAKEDFKKIIPKFINIINNQNVKDNKNNIGINNYSNEVRINICIVFGNLIKFYGDEDSNKICSEFNIYYKFFVNDFIESSFKEENIISGLSFYLLRVIMNAIQYSSKDLQVSLESLFSNLIQKCDQITSLIKNNKNKIQKIYLEKLYKLQENVCLVLNQIFNKIIMKINISLCIKLYNALIDSFLTRESKAYESGMLCLLNLIILLFNDNVLKDNKIDVDIFYKLIVAILINKEDGDNMKKIAILCILNLVKINSCTLIKFIGEIHQILKNIALNCPNENKEYKQLVNKAIEDIEKIKIK